MAKNFKTKKLDRTNNGRMLAFFLGGMATALAIVSVGVFAQEVDLENEDESLVIEIGTDFDPNYVPESTFNAINSAIYEALSGYAKSSDIEQQFTELVTQIESTYATKNNLENNVSALSDQASALSNQMSTLSDQMSTLSGQMDAAELDNKIHDYIYNNSGTIACLVSAASSDPNATCPLK